MRVAVLSRFPLIDVLGWKRAILEELVRNDDELLVVHSRSGPAEQARHALSTIAEGRVNGRGPDYPGREEGSSKGLPLHLWARRNGCRTLLVRRLDQRRCREAIRAFGADAMLLLGADIVSGAVLNCVEGPTLNAHFGLLPQYRGMNVTEWAVFNDDPVGVSLHTVDPGIDTGGIVSVGEVHVRPGDDLASIRERQRQISGELMLNAIEAIRTGTLATTDQPPGEGRQYYRMHPAFRARAEHRLRTGEYRWMR